MQGTIDGATIHSEADFHRAIARALDFPSFYGENIHALRDVMTGMLERPAHLIWKNSELSRQRLGDTYDLIVSILQKAVDHDRDAGWTRRFELTLE